ncbi:MAG TPA: outer membrane lipoprotein-sorting protein [Bacteroidetes bacterium]|nr:outer membrane lipoprotein-sorting protein [Bacteroidota bacterium]
MKAQLTSLLLLFPMVCPAQTPDGTEILKRMDANLTSDSRVFTSKMIIHGRRSSRTVESKTWSMGDRKAFTEYLSPPREAGTKMLKLEDALWIYSPSTDRTIQIAGHMLKQSVMGSDLSYEDMMEDASMADQYEATVTGTEQVNGRPCWVLQLEAVKEDVTYASRKVWVDRERYIPLKEELYAKSGTLLKKTEVFDVKRIDGRWFPGKIVFRDMLKQGGGTEFIIESIEFNAEIPEHLFTKAALR